MPDSARVLLVEDDEPLATAISAAAGRQGWIVVHRALGEDALQAAGTGGFDLVLLDINLPGIDGFETLARLRVVDPGLPVLMLTARDSVDDRVRGLDGGAEDYLVKPFALEELLARMRVLMRRHGARRALVVRHGPLAFDLGRRCATLHGELLPLSARESDLLAALLADAGQVVTKNEAARALGAEGPGQGNLVEVYVSRLRAKLEPHGVRIRTVRGFGYLLERWRDGGT